jgi:hypothetical protein
MERVMSCGSWATMCWLRDTYSTDEMTDFLVRKGHRLAPRNSRTGRSSQVSSCPLRAAAGEPRGPDHE